METYDPNTSGVIVAMRIFYAENGFTPMAELVFAFGRSKTIRWDVIEENEIYLPGINAYTLIYDERPKKEFNEWKHPNEFQMMADAVQITKNIFCFEED